MASNLQSVIKVCHLILFASTIIVRDAGKNAVETFLETLVPAIQTDAELQELHRAIGVWNSSGSELNVPNVAGVRERREPLAPERPAVPPQPNFRVHCADIQLTFNHHFVPRGQTVLGHKFVSSFLCFAGCTVGACV